MAKIKERTLYIDILKAIACICVLIGHVIGGIIKAGMDVSDSLYYIHTSVYLFHVPCFFFASGYLYANNPVKEWKKYKTFVVKKLVALGVPYVVCTTLYVGLSSFLSTEMNPNTSFPLKSLLNIWKEPIAFHWYLYALIVLFITIPAIELIFRRVNRNVLWIGMTLLMCMGGGYSEWPCINYILQYSYLFYMGVIWNGTDNNGIKNCLLRHDKTVWCGIYCAEIILFSAIYIMVIDANIVPAETSILWKNIITVSLVITIVRVSYVIAQNETWVRKVLLWVAGYSLYIYLFHIWFSGTMRVVLRRLGMTHDWIQVFVGCVCGLFGPVILAKIIRKTPMLRFWIEPLAVLKEKR